MATTVRPCSMTQVQAREVHLRWQPFIQNGMVYKFMEKPTIQIDRGTITLASITGNNLCNIARAGVYNLRKLINDDGKQGEYQP
jgi:hypothetical protein